MDFWNILQQYGPLLLQGTGTTLILTGAAVTLAACAATPLAIVRTAAPPPAQALVRLYVSFFRGTPLLAQLFLLYYGSGQFRPELQTLGLWWFFREPFNCALLVLTLNSAAYQTEILRGGLQGVPREEVEAAAAIGMSAALRYRRVILPHAWRIALPALGNEVILLMKGSALASVITIYDLMGQTRTAFARTFDFSVYLQAAALYLAITVIFVQCWRMLEKRINRHVGAAPQPAGAEGRAPEHA